MAIQCTQLLWLLAPLRLRDPQASLEPPIPGLCSQPGADLDAYRTVKVQLELLSGSVFALGAACNRGRMSDLAAAAGMPEEQQRAMRSVLAGSLGLAAAACGRIAEALAYMPALRPCSGELLVRQGRAWVLR